jgi:hypothetical protein
VATIREKTGFGEIQIRNVIYRATGKDQEQGRGGLYILGIEGQFLNFKDLEAEPSRNLKTK